MPKLPSAKSVPRVPRSRRDDRFVKAQQVCPKRAGAAVVTSRQGDTVTVLMSGEELTGVIPLGEMPPIGAYVEVESRCDLLVILDWDKSAEGYLKLGDWYFTPAESPGWTEGESNSPLGMGERVTHDAAEEPGFLWNRSDFSVREGDLLAFTMQVSNLLSSEGGSSSVAMPITELEARYTTATADPAVLTDGSDATAVRISSGGVADWNLHLDGASLVGSTSLTINLRFNVISHGAGKPFAFRWRLIDQDWLTGDIRMSPAPYGLTLPDGISDYSLTIDDAWVQSHPNNPPHADGGAAWIEGIAEGDETYGPMMTALGPNPILMVYGSYGLPYEVDLLGAEVVVDSQTTNAPTSVQLAMCWDGHGSDPQPETGEVVTYGPVVTVDSELIEFSAVATAPQGGQGRLGLRYVSGGTGGAVTPSWVGVTSTPYQPSALPGGITALGDDDDATYAEQWLSIRSSIPNGPVLAAEFDPMTVTGVPTLRMRYQVANATGGTGTRFAVFATDVDTGFEVGTFSLNSSTFDSTAPSTGTIHDTTAWYWEQTGSKTFEESAATGIRIGTRRLEPGGEANGDYMIRVYELSLGASEESSPGAVDVLMQAEALTQDVGSAGALLRGVAPGIPTERELVAHGSWAQRYDGDGAQLEEPGVSQGGHERSLVGFDLELPDDAEVWLVRLQVPWTHWTYANGIGSLLLGWHDASSAPANWTVGAGGSQLSMHDVRVDTPLDLVLPWAASAVGAGFGGLVIGPGYSDGPLYAGSTEVDPDQWRLTVRYRSAQE